MTQEEVKNMILFRKDGTTAYNDRLREINALLEKYKYSPTELELIARDVWNCLPGWRKKQIGRG